MKPEIYVSVISALAAIASALFAYKSLRISRKALSLAEIEQLNKSKKVVSYLKESFKKKYDGIWVYAFAVNYINKAEIANSITRIELHINYSRADGSVSHLIFPLAEKDSLFDEFYKFDKIEVPIIINGRSSVSGWVFFKIPTGAIPGYIEKYQVVAITASDDSVDISTFLMKEIVEENELQKS